MIYAARSATSIAAGLIARTVTRSDITDISETGQVSGFLSSVAEDASSIEERLERILASYDFMQAVGTDLDIRAGDLPGSPERVGWTAATGDVLTVSRDDTSAELVIPAGSVYGRTDDSPVRYVQTAALTLAAGVASGTTGIAADTAGRVGNAGAGVITRVLSAPDGITVTNTVLSTGTDRESDDQFKRRILRYLSTLARTQREVLVYVARLFTGFPHVAVYEDVTRPGYTELMIDDGTGLTGYTRPGVATEGTIPLGGQRVIYHEHPATEPINIFQLTRTPAGGSMTSGPVHPDITPRWTSAPELGEVWLPAGYFEPGDQWHIGAIVGYSVYTGPIKELQDIVNGDPDDPVGVPGHRASGGRVRVVPPNVETIAFSLNIVAETGASLTNLRDAVKEEIVTYMRNLAPGEALRINDLARKILGLDGLVNFTWNQANLAGTATVYQDHAPTTPRSALRSTTADIEVV